MGCDFKACVVCLNTATDVKLIEIGDSDIRKLYNSTAGLQTTKCDVLPNYVCTACLAQTRSFHAFRNKCQRSYFILQELAKHETITEECLKLLDRTALGISSTLAVSETLAFSLNTELDYYVLSNYKISNDATSIQEELENESMTLEDNIIDLTELDNSLLDHTYQNTIKEEVTLIKTETDETKDEAAKNQPKAIKKKNPKGLSKVNSPQKRTTPKSISNKRDISKYLSCRLLTPKEQYGTVLDREKTEKYVKAKYKCNYCFTVFKVESALRNHLRKHDPKLFGQMQCDICKSCFKYKAQVKLHIDRLHTYKFSCNQCEFICVCRSFAVKHYEYHENVTYNCPHCDQKFMKPNSCLSHMRIHHPSAFLCQICGNNFLALNGLKRHQRLIHSDEEMRIVSDMVLDIEGPLYCKDCNIQFVSEEAFDNHLNHSTKHQPNKKKLKLLNKGKRLEGEFKCDVCGKLHQNNHRLEVHYKQEHSEYKQYICEICGYATQVHANLNLHYRTHTREKPYQCEHCELRFSTKGNYRRHVAAVHMYQRHKCDLCDSTFTEKYTVKLHKQTVHMKIPYPPWQKNNRKRKEKKAAAEWEDTVTS